MQQNPAGESSAPTSSSVVSAGSVLCEQLALPLVMLSIVAQCAVGAVLSCMHVLLSCMHVLLSCMHVLLSTADNGTGLDHHSAHFCLCCAGDLCQSLSAMQENEMK